MGINQLNSESIATLISFVSVVLVLIPIFMVKRPTHAASEEPSRMASLQSPNTETAEYKIQETRLGPIDEEVLNQVFSRDSQHFAYVKGMDQKQCVIVDGHAGAEYDEILTRSLIFSPDSQRVAYGARKGAKCFVVVDGQAGTECDRILTCSLIFSPDSQRVAYVAETYRPHKKWQG